MRAQRGNCYWERHRSPGLHCSAAQQGPHALLLTRRWDVQRRFIVLLTGLEGAEEVSREVGAGMAELRPVEQTSQNQNAPCEIRTHDLPLTKRTPYQLGQESMHHFSPNVPKGRYIYLRSVGGPLACSWSRLLQHGPMSPAASLVAYQKPCSPSSASGDRRALPSL